MAHFDPLPLPLRGYLEHLRKMIVSTAKNAQSDNVSVYRELMAKLSVYDMLLSPTLGEHIKRYMDSSQEPVKTVSAMEIGRNG